MFLKVECVFHFHSNSKSECTLSISLPFGEIYDLSWSFLTGLVRLKAIFSDCYLYIQSCWIFKAFAVEVDVSHILIPSANNETFESIFKLISLIETRNKIRPSPVPLENTPHVLIRLNLLLKKLGIHSPSFPQTPIFLNFWQRITWSILSKAFCEVYPDILFLT